MTQKDSLRFYLDKILVEGYVGKGIGKDIHVSENITLRVAYADRNFVKIRFISYSTTMASIIYTKHLARVSIICDDTYYSPTTMKHINYLMDYFREPHISKKQWEDLYIGSRII